MKKKLLTLARISTAGTSFTALADTPNFYGRADLALTNSDTAFATQNGKSGTIIENNFSWLGVKGTEKINDNFEVIYQMEFGVSNFDNSNNTFAARNSFLGIKTVAGTALVGRNDTVFKSAEGGLDLFGNSNSDIDLLVVGQNREADGFTYYSPKIADLITLNATYLVDDNHTRTRPVNSSMYAISATLGDKAITAQNFYAAVAYQEGISDVEALRGVAQARFGDFIIGGLYQNSQSQDTDLAHLDGNSYFVEAAYVMGALKLKAAYGYDDSGLGKYVTRYINSDDDTNHVLENMKDFDIQQFSLGADYKLNQSTMVYGHYTHYDGSMQLNDAPVDLSDNIVTVGLRVDF